MHNFTHSACTFMFIRDNGEHIQIYWNKTWELLGFDIDLVSEAEDWSDMECQLLSYQLEQECAHSHATVHMQQQ